VNDKRVSITAPEAPASLRISRFASADDAQIVREIPAGATVDVEIPAAMYGPSYRLEVVGAFHATECRKG
jgi:hypothetical protein